MIKPSVRALPLVSVAPPSAASGDSRAVIANANENPYEWPEGFKQRVCDGFARASWARYPEARPTALLAALSAYAEWPEDGIVAGNGSDDLLQALFLATSAPGSSVLFPDPGFVVYRTLAALTNMEAIAASLAPDFSYDVRSYLEAISRQPPSLTLVTSPNNPTGGTMALSDLERLAHATRGAGILAIDEAYVEFSRTSALSLVERHDHVVILRTLSKALALAGLRVGYLLARPELAREIDKARGTFNVNTFSQAAAIEALKDEGPERMRQTAAKIARSRARLAERLANVPGVRVHPSEANFLLVEFLPPRGGETPLGASVAHALATGAPSILVRSLSHSPRLAHCVRVSVSTDEENEAMVEGLRRVLASPPLPLPPLRTS